MQHSLPLIFNFREVVQGNGFIAGVAMSGRALLEVEDGETWISGVAPAGFAGGGVTRDQAYADFKRGWIEVLFDIAAEAPSFREFETACTEFLASTSEQLTGAWEAALAEVRSKRLSDDSLPTVNADEHRVEFQVAELVPSQATPQKNAVELGFEAAA